MRFHKPLNIAESSSWGTESAPRRARTIASIVGSLCCCKRKLSRATRFMQLRPTARLMCFLAMTKPKRAWSESLNRASIKKLGWEARIGASLKTQLYASAFNRRCCLLNRKWFWGEGKVSTIFCFGSLEPCFETFKAEHLGKINYAASSLRPLARRRAKILRPPLVAIRARKPWVRLRFKTLGWNVLFMASLPEVVTYSIRINCPGNLGRFGTRDNIEKAKELQW